MNYNIKLTLFKILVSLNDFYLLLNQKLLFAWRIVLAKQSNNKITYFFKTMVENPTTALPLNTILFYLLSTLLSGGHGLIGMVFNWLALLNIVVYVANLLGWINKLKK